MATKTVRIVFDVDNEKLESSIDLLEKAKVIDKSAADSFKQSNEAYRQRDHAIKEVAEHTQEAVKATKKLADETTSSSKIVQSETKNTASGFEKLTSSLKNVAASVALAFGVQQIIQFAKTSVDTAIEVERLNKQLLVALNNRKDVQERLISQAKELEKSTGFDDKAIIKQQTFLALQGRSESQINKTIEAAIRLAKVTGTDLDTAITQLDGTLEGNVGRLGKLDSRFKDLTKTQLESGAAIDIVNKKYGEILTTQTATEKSTNDFHNAVEDLQEGLGSLLLKGTPVLNFLTGIIDRINELSQSDQEIEFNINVKETRGAKDSAVSDLLASRDAYIKAGKSQEEAITQALKDEIEVRRKLGIEANSEGNFRQTLIYQAQIDALKEAGAAELEALKANEKAKDEERKKAGEKAAKEAERLRKLDQDALNKNKDENKRFQNELLKDKIQDEITNEKIESDALEKKIANFQDAELKKREAQNQTLQNKLDNDALEAEEEEKLNQLKLQLAEDFAQELADTIFEINSSNIQAEQDEALKRLDAQRELELDNKRLTSEQRKQIEERYQKQEAKIKHDAAIKQRTNDIIQAQVNGLMAITAILSDHSIPSLTKPFLIAAAVAQNALQVAAITSKPIPQYAKGKEYVDGPGTGTSDSIPAMLSKGERIFDAETNERYYPVLSAIHNKKISPKMANALAKIPDLNYLPIGPNISEQDILSLLNLTTAGVAIDYDRLGKSVATHVMKAVEDSQYKNRNTGKEVVEVLKKLNISNPDYDPRKR